MKEVIPKHHAVLIEGPVEETLASIHRDVDTMFLNYDSLGIDEARSIREASLTAPLKEERRRIIVSFSNITREAQNALLKIFEDPSPQVEFLIVTENANALLPTLRSRLYLVRSLPTIGFANRQQQANKESKKFLNMPVADKLEEVEKMVKAQKDSGSKAEIRSFLLSLHDELTRTGEDSTTALSALHKAMEYLEDKGASTKVLLESVALAI